MIPRLVVASKNPDKIAEIEHVLLPLGLADEIVTDLDWPDVEETGETLAENALLKARAVTAATGLPAVGDDTGLEVYGLDGRPGVRTARFAGPDASYSDNVRLLLSEMDGVADRAATFRTVVALVWPDGAEMVANGFVQGVITHEPRGVGGFGYDPVFEVDGRTLAEMSLDEKSALLSPCPCLAGTGLRPRPVSAVPRVVIVGGGFGGLNAAKALKRAPVEITIIDRRNFHLFQPLLYQVAAAALNPSDIAYPIRLHLPTSGEPDTGPAGRGGRHRPQGEVGPFGGWWRSRIRLSGGGRRGHSFLLRP